MQKKPAILKVKVATLAPGFFPVPTGTVFFFRPVPLRVRR